MLYSNNYNLLFIKLGYKTKMFSKISADFFVATEKSFNNPYSLGNDLNATGNRFFNPSAPSGINIGAKFQFAVK